MLEQGIAQVLAETGCNQIQVQRVDLGQSGKQIEIWGMLPRGPSASPN